MNNRTKKVYLAKARHNLKNPINAILGYSEMLIEDCEDYNLNEIIKDLEKIYNSGKLILENIEDNFSDIKINKSKMSISDIAKNTQISIRTPLNTIIGYSEMISENKNINVIKNFNSDINKIILSGKSLEKEIQTIINFKSDDLNTIKNTTSNLTMVKDVLDSIKPISNDSNIEHVIGNILAVDDNINNTDLLKKRLEKNGHSVTTANNGNDAITKLLNNVDYDLILLDIVMPEINGYEVLKYIKNDKRFHFIPVIMISSMDDIDSIYRCIELGADDYITKPFEKSILDARIMSCIEKKQLRDKEKILLTKVKKEKEKSDKLLLNILPKDIANRLKSGEKEIADSYNDITIIFTDIVNFTPQANDIPADKLVRILNNVVKSFDQLAITVPIKNVSSLKFNSERLKLLLLLMVGKGILQGFLLNLKNC